MVLFFPLAKEGSGGLKIFRQDFFFDMSSGFNIRRETRILMWNEWTAPQSQKQLAEMSPIRWASFEPIL